MKYIGMFVVLLSIVAGCANSEKETPSVKHTYAVICPMNAFTVAVDTIQGSWYMYHESSLSVYGRERSMIPDRTYPVTCMIKILNEPLLEKTPL